MPCVRLVCLLRLAHCRRLQCRPLRRVASCPNWHLCAPSAPSAATRYLQFGYTADTIAPGWICGRVAELRVHNIMQATCVCACVLQEDLPQSSGGGSGDADLPEECGRGAGSSRTRSNSGAHAGLDALAGTSGAAADGAREGADIRGADPAEGEGANKPRFRSARLQKRAEREGPRLTQARPLTPARDLMCRCAPVACD